ncbi:hypothetical protein FSST1_006537 [Fusarium sambucinum]
METSRAGLGVKGNSLKANDDTWIRGEKSQAEGGLIILGQRTEELSWALRWWLPPDAPMPLEIDEEEVLIREYKEWQVVGIGEIGQGLEGSIANDSTSTQPGDSQTSLNLDETQSKKHRKLPKSLAIQSHDSLERLYTKHMFHTFMWDAVAALDKPIWQDLEIESFGTFDSNPDSNSVHLQCKGLSDLAKAIQSTGFGDLPDAYSALIPPLEAQSQLGTPDSTIDMVSIEATEHQRVLHWNKAGDVYQRLFDLAQRFPEKSYFYKRSIAMIVDFVRIIDFSMVGEWEKKKVQFEDAILVKNRLAAALESLPNREFLMRLQKLYSRQQRPWEAAFFVGQDHFPIQHDEQADCNFTPLHRFLSLSPNDPNFLRKDTVHGYRATSYNPNPEKRNIPPELMQYVDSLDILGWTPLHYASRCEVWTEALLHEQHDVDAKDISGWTPLHYAFLSGSFRVVTLLIDNGADPNARGVDGMTPLHCAALSGNGYLFPFTSENVRQAMDIFARDNLGRAPIHLATWMGDKPLIRELAGSIEETDRNKQTPLHWAIQVMKDETVTLLVDLGSNLNAMDDRYMTPMLLSATYGNTFALSKLVDKGGNINEINRKPGSASPLHIASRRGHTEFVEKLLQLNAQVETRNFCQETPLILAVKKGRSAIADLLIKHHADVNAMDMRGRTALTIAILRGHRDLVNIIVAEGATINPRAIKYAESKDNHDLAIFLRRAHSLQQSFQAHIPLAWARLVWKASLGRLLRKQGCNL